CRTARPAWRCPAGRETRVRSSAVGAETAALLLLTGACASGPAGPGADAGTPSGSVTVFAAATLKESFTTLGRRFEKSHPGTEVAFNFGGSDSLAAGITKIGRAHV